MDVPFFPQIRSSITREFPLMAPRAPPSQRSAAELLFVPYYVRAAMHAFRPGTRGPMPHCTDDCFVRPTNGSCASSLLESSPSTQGSVWILASTGLVDSCGKPRHLHAFVLAQGLPRRIPCLPCRNRLCHSLFLSTKAQPHALLFDHSTRTCDGYNSGSAGGMHFERSACTCTPLSLRQQLFFLAQS